MDDKTLQRKLDQFVRLGNELDAEAKRRYGPQAFLAHEAEAGIFLMAQDYDSLPEGERRYHGTRSHDWVRERATPSPMWNGIAW